MLTSGVAVTGCEGSDVGGDRGAVAAGAAGLAAGPGSVGGVGWTVSSGPFAAGRPGGTAAAPSVVVVAGTAVPTGVVVTVGRGGVAAPVGAGSGAVTSSDTVTSTAGTEAGTAATGDGDSWSGVSSRRIGSSRSSERVVRSVAGLPYSVPASAVGSASPTTGRSTGGTQDTPSNDNANATR